MRTPLSVIVHTLRPPYSIAYPIIQTSASCTFSAFTSISLAMPPLFIYSDTWDSRAAWHFYIRCPQLVLHLCVRTSNPPLKPISQAVRCASRCSALLSQPAAHSHHQKHQCHVVDALKWLCGLTSACRRPWRSLFEIRVPRSHASLSRFRNEHLPLYGLG